MNVREMLGRTALWTNHVEPNAAWTSFDKVSSAAASGKEVRFVYDAEHERALERYFAGGALQRTTVYIHPGSGAGLWYEEETGFAGTKMKHYISADQGAFAVIVCTANPCTDANNSSTQYWHKDQLGSVHATSNAAQAIERLAFEPFGKRRYSNGPTDIYRQLAPTNTDRGFTGHSERTAFRSFVKSTPLANRSKWDRPAPARRHLALVSFVSHMPQRGLPRIYSTNFTLQTA
jgi:hypothetical protein